MEKCCLCEKQFRNLNGLAKHIHASHDFTGKQYYDSFIHTVNAVCVCGKEKKFRDLDEGYREYCSPRCRSEHVVSSKPWLGKKQPLEMIEKRRNTQLERYGVPCGFLTHKSKAARYKGHVCRSTYEMRFLDFAQDYGYTVSVPPRVAYTYEGRSRYYYPDFFIEELDLIVEVKSDWTLQRNFDLNICKFESTLEQGHRIVIIDEEDGLLNTEQWEELNEHLRSV